MKTKKTMMEDMEQHGSGKARMMPPKMRGMGMKGKGGKGKAKRK